ncbi:hypothetical protein FY131_27015 (plasmid) [Agrobacterium tumefaciens]|nr:hypothetical protein FY131_27015 [Agrobacterium tumefaciens]
MKHSIEWQDDAINAAPEEKATVGDLRLFVDGKNATHHLFEDNVGDHVTVALYGLVLGLVHDWWRIFGERDHAITLAKYRSGYLLPDVRLQFDGAAFEVAVHQRAYDNPDVRFWGGMVEVMSRADGEAWLTSFIEEVLDRLTSAGLGDTSAHLRWRRVRASCRMKEEKAFCEAVGSLGLDPYQISEEVAAFVEEAEQVFSDKEALIEFVSGSGETDKRKLMSWVHRMARTAAGSYRLADLRAVVGEVAAVTPARAEEPAWALGYRRAQSVRRACGLEQNHRFTSFKHLAERFGAGQSYSLAPTVDGINALRRDRPDGVHIHLRNHGDSAEARASHLFAMARAIGDAACFPRTGIAPINGLQRAFRQSAGRAFAAEFLAPIDEVMSMRADKRDVFSIANEFAVSPALIERQIENKARIKQACD